MKDVFKLLNCLNIALISQSSHAVHYPRNLKLCMQMCKMLYEEGFILSYFYDLNFRKLVILTNVYKNKSVIKGITSFNKSVAPLYIKYSDIVAMGKIGVSVLILSTNRGFLPHYLALKYKLGGKAICLLK